MIVKAHLYLIIIHRLMTIFKQLAVLGWLIGVACQIAKAFDVIINIQNVNEEQKERRISTSEG